VFRPAILIAAVLALSAGTASGYGPAEEMCFLAKPSIQESSGIVASSRSADVFFTHNDSGDRPRFFAIDTECRLLATIEVEGATASDWEDIARGSSSDGTPALFIGDFGNNNLTRRNLVVYEVPEPVIDPQLTDQELSVGVTASHPFMYEDVPQDAESLIVVPQTREIIIVSKFAGGISGVYVLGPPPIGQLPLIARRVALVNFLTLGASGREATGADMTADGSRLVIRTYEEAFEWASTGDLATTFDAAPLHIPLPDTRQGEAIAYTIDGSAMVTTTEYSGWIHRIPT